MSIWRLWALIVLITSFTFGEEVIKKPFLWEVSKPGVKSFYLFGTMHFQDTRFVKLPKVLQTAIDKSDEVRTEIPMDMDTQLKSMALMVRNDQKTLRQILPKELYSQTEHHLKKISPQLDLLPFENLKIWALSAMLSMLENQMQNAGLPDIDLSIYRYAQETKKGVDGIETVQEQIGAMDKLNLQEQIIGLESTLEYMDENSDYTNEMKELYFLGDEEKMLGFIEGMMYQKEKYKAFEEKFMKVILYDRNELMFERIETLVNQKPNRTYLFAFGVMHFLGKPSVLTLLKEKGYTIKRYN